jgi:hypothetical protein
LYEYTAILLVSPINLNHFEFCGYNVKPIKFNILESEGTVNCTEELPAIVMNPNPPDLDSPT